MSEESDRYNAADREGRAASDEHLPALEADVQAVLGRAVQTAIANLEAASGELRAAAGWRLPNADEVLPLQQITEWLSEVLEPWRVRVIEAQMGPALAAFGVGFDVKNPLVAGVLHQLGNKITHVSETTRAEIMDVIDQAWQDGASIRDAATAINVQYETIGVARASTIARTELIAAQNGGSLAGVRITGAATHKTWLATIDTRTRVPHILAHGEAVRIDQTFSVDGEPLHYPGDPSGQPENVINCRCTMLYGDNPAGELTAAGAGGTMKRIHPALAHLMPTGRLTAVTLELTAAGDGRSRWQGNGVMFVDTPTGDTRSFAKPPSDAGWPAEGGMAAIPWHGELPLPLMAMFQDEHGGWGSSALSELAGHIDALRLDGNAVYAEGAFADNEAGARLKAAVEAGDMTTVSADPYPYAWQYIFPPVPELEEGTMEQLFEAFFGMNTEEVIMDESIMDQVQVRFTKWSMMGLTAVPFPAFHGYENGEKAQIEVVSEDNAVAPELTAAVASPIAAPEDHFHTPEADTGAVGLTWEDDGRVYGHVARWDGCHTGFGASIGNGNECVTTPRSRTDYAYYHLGEYVSAEGNVLYVGTISMDTGHAPGGLRREGVIRHYDDTATAVAYGVMLDGAHGVWFSGTRAPGLTDEQLVRARAAKPSGDWRNINGNLEMMGVLMVNVPGFPIARILTAAAPGGEQEVIAAFGIGTEPTAEYRASLKTKVARVKGGRAGVLSVIRGE